ncbi:DUF2931 family protein [Pseudomonas sp. N40(2020)]|uniref:DUF2931 family protein n=1 Tax=Pseudomonas sp. N40(2020) TaxID=2767798 RepID=UPI001656FBFF|nr:DUF2931 family protein [Pseudomonas sp. N40(2020)]MBC9000209.1 DUF2931 family protein [Pseudomonas sp. N40(2020)]
MKAMIALLGVLLLAGCQTGSSDTGANDPKSPWWELGFIEPDYMKVWVEDSSVLDINNRMFFRVGGKSAAGGEPEDGTESARGWGVAGGAGIPVTGADLPKLVFVRWQSISEQKTYKGFIEIPEEARQLMVKSTHQRCPETPKKAARYMASLYVGLAPGGVLQAWVRDSCHHPTKVAHAQGEIEPLGPQQGKHGGRYAYPVSEKAKRYIERWGIPYGSW